LPYATEIYVKMQILSIKFSADLATKFKNFGSNNISICNLCQVENEHFDLNYLSQNARTCQTLNNKNQILKTIKLLGSIKQRNRQNTILSNKRYRFKLRLN